MKNHVMILLGLTAILLLQTAAAEKIVSMVFVIDVNDSVSLEYLKVIEGKATFYLNPGPYHLEITDADKKTIAEETFEVVFESLTNPPTPVNEAMVSLKLPYSPDMRDIKLSRRSKLMYSREIDVCNKNNVCEPGFETYLSCPQDCPLDEPDKWCTKEADGVCDPDCYEGVDPDCGGGEDADVQAATSSTLPAGGNGDSSMRWLIYVVALLVLAVAGILFYRRREKQDIVRQREEFLKWKEEREKLAK